MKDMIELSIVQFSLVYLLLIIVLIIMKKAKIDKTKVLLIASARMSIQLILAGFILTFLFANPHPFLTLLYVLVMIVFSIRRSLSLVSNLNSKFKRIIAISLFSSTLLISIFFIVVVINTSIFNPQYVIPITGMIIGNSMTGVNLGLQSFSNSIESESLKINSLLGLGVHPKQILLPMVNKSFETAFLPTINSMLGIGIIFLPGMMTGQILAGALPMMAILYQIAVMIAICSSVCLSIFLSLNFGYQTMYDKRLRLKI